MGRQTNISWTDSTFNPWIGCTKVSAGCKFCYAEGLNHRYGHDNWGPGKTRRMTTDTYWRQPLKWNREAADAGERLRIFCASMADVFDPEAPMGGRERLWQMIEATPMLDWLLLTKRPQNITKMVPPTWLDKPQFNVWYGTSVEDDKVAYRIDQLAAVPAAIRFLSIEPMIGEVSFGESFSKMNWAIFGGESGFGARPMAMHWVRRGLRHCRKSGVTPFVKQLGHVWAKKNEVKDSGTDINTWPQDLRIQQFPRDRYGVDRVRPPARTSNAAHRAGTIRLPVVAEPEEIVA
jgi:protein gp37